MDRGAMIDHELHLVVGGKHMGARMEIRVITRTPHTHTSRVSWKKQVAGLFDV